MSSPSGCIGSWEITIRQLRRSDPVPGMKLVGAGLEIACERNISDERLFENLMRLWEHYGSATARMKARGVPFLMWRAARSPDCETAFCGVHQRPNRLPLSLLSTVRTRPVPPNVSNTYSHPPLKTWPPESKWSPNLDGSLGIPSISRGEHVVTSPAPSLRGDFRLGYSEYLQYSELSAPPAPPLTQGESFRADHQSNRWLAVAGSESILRILEECGHLSAGPITGVCLAGIPNQRA